MTLHREGTVSILIALIVCSGLQYLNFLLFVDFSIIYIILSVLIFGLFFTVVQFFRIPKRSISATINDVIAPADGKVVVIEEVVETEYFNDKRIQVSIFMSPINVHANYYPIQGIVNYVKYHKGLFLVAWHPKSSTDNERSTVVVKHDSGQEVLFRQVAGALARRICLYSKENTMVKHGEEFGFIKFGSRVDLYFPLNTEINVKIGETVKGRITKIAELK